ncbi:hypothetical protein ACFWA1_16765 [Streptomyces sp. NPDC060005]|uniref:hypothetical protein n=1 Tax=Streptomyces sp. NPDC060005 TaxID=3347034 RepID=UPI0036C72E0B
MCVSTGEAEFTGTTLYGGRLRHPEHGLIHVLGYQNTVANLADGPNAMVLHLPTYRMGRRNFLSVGTASDLLQSMVDAVKPVGARPLPDVLDWMGGDAVRAVQVFEHDVYTVLLAHDPAALPAALARVPERRRPALGGELWRFYEERYPGQAVAVCCFDNKQAARAKPLLMWYPPIDPDVLTLPALDCHTGAVPDPGADVAVDHWVLFGTDEAPGDWGSPVDYGHGVPEDLRPFLPRSVMGDHFGGTLPNGDFAITHADLLQSRITEGDDVSFDLDPRLVRRV